MPLTLPSLSGRQIFFLVLLALSSALPAGAEVLHLTPDGAGTRDGADWANARDLTQLQRTLDALKPGDTLQLGSGTYRSTTPIELGRGGSETAPVSIVGVDTGGGLPVLEGDHDIHRPKEAPAKVGLRFGGESHHWTLRQLRLRHYGYAIQMTAAGTSDTVRTHIVFDDVDGSEVDDFLQLQNASDVVVRNCDVVRYCKKAFRYADYLNRVTFENCTADATGGDLAFPTRAIPNGFCGGDTHGETRIRNITFIDCTARNNRYQPQERPYWNGDGFASEEGTDQLTYIRCHSFDNDDGGFDDKADNITYLDCIATGNAKGFRYWGNNGVYRNCLSAFNQARGGNNASDGLWVGKQARGHLGVAHVFNSTFYNNGQWALDSYHGGRITVTDSIIASDERMPAAGIANDGDITLVNTVTYQPGGDADRDPQLVAAQPNWHGKPANAFDSRRYQGAKGYDSEANASRGR